MKRALVALALLVACNEKTAPPAPSPPTTIPGVVTAPNATRQIVTAVVDDWTSTRAELQLWSRTGTQPWTAVGASWPAVIGRNGSAWGLGLHAEPARPGPLKREGDGKAPAGMFALRAAYGYADTAPSTKLPYRPSAGFECVDDPASHHYATIVNRSQATVDWASSEQMRRDDGLYTWVIDVAHNPTATPNAGSCIFLHVWGGPQSTTSGCTAMEEPRLVELLNQIDPALQPRYVLLPRADYQALQSAWDLPPLSARAQ